MLGYYDRCDLLVGLGSGQRLRVGRGCGPHDPGRRLPLGQETGDLLEIIGYIPHRDQRHDNHDGAIPYLTDTLAKQPHRHQLLVSLNH